MSALRAPSVIKKVWSSTWEKGPGGAKYKLTGLFFEDGYVYETWTKEEEPAGSPSRKRAHSPEKEQDDKPPYKKHPKTNLIPDIYVQQGASSKG